MFGRAGAPAGQTAKGVAAGVVESANRGQFGFALPSTVISNRDALHDAEYLLYYSHAIEAGLIGFLVSGIFLSVFTYPHFWLMTALVVSLKHIARERIKELEEPMVSTDPVKVALVVR